MTGSTPDINVMPYVPCRLDKYLRDAAGLSRREAHAAWSEGRVEFEGAAHHATFVMEDDEVRLDGQLVRPIAASLYYMINKPAGIVTAERDENKPCLDRWLEPLGTRVFPVGRLDRATTGLLLLTDDGNLAHKLLEPKYHAEKAYALTFSQESTPDQRQRLLDGVTLHDGFAAALRIEVESPLHLNMVIDQGRNRIIRRMCKAVRLRLVHLHRFRMGSLELGDLPLGEVRTLSGAEVEALWSGVGGRLAVWNQRVDALRRRVAQLHDLERPDARLEGWLRRIDEQAR